MKANNLLSIGKDKKKKSETKVANIQREITMTASCTHKKKINVGLLPSIYKLLMK